MELFKKMDTRETAHIFSGLMDSVVHQWMVHARNESLVAKRALVKDHFLSRPTKERGKE